MSVKSEKAIQQTVSVKFILGWSYYLLLMRIENVEERKFYEIEAVKNNWSVRELDCHVNSSLSERLCISKEKQEIVKLYQKGANIRKSIRFN